MNLYILRHGIAADLESTDANRPLTAKGERKLAQVIEGMETMELTFDLILSSPVLRARQTAEMVARAFKARRDLQWSEALATGSGPRRVVEALAQIRPEPENVLLVGHEPTLSELVSLLVAGRGGLRIELKKAGLCKLSTESLRAGRCATLEWLLTPRQMAVMGR
jgi:phosphohistidine phosphatase